MRRNTKNWTRLVMIAAFLSNINPMIILAEDTSQAAAESTHDEVVVTSELEQKVQSGKLEVPIRESVQTVEIITKETLEDRNATTINKAIETAVGVQAISGYGGMDSAGIISRGFANDWVLRNGFRLFRFGVPADPVLVEEIQVLKGPASLLAGQTDPGGTLNIISKAPVKKPFAEFQGTVGSFDFYRGEVDAGGALFGTDGQLFSRFSFAYEDSGSHRDGIDQNKIIAAPQIAWQLGDQTLAQIEVDYLKNEFDFERGLPPSELSLQVPTSRVLKDPRLPKSESENVAVFESITHDLSNQWKIRQGFGAMFNRNDMQETYIGSPDANGDLDIFVDRSVEENRSMTGQLETLGEWTLGGQKQKSIVGVEYSYYNFGYDFYDQDGTFSPVGSVNIFNPQYNYALPELNTPVFGGDYGSKATSLYFDHQAQLPGKVKVMAGGRYDRVKGFQEDRITQTASYPDKTNSRFSPRGGLVYTPFAPMDVFASYATSFKPNVFGTDASGNAFDPEIGQQWEGGFRHEILPGQLRAQVAAYEIKKKNVVVYEPPSFTAGHTGERESRGVEIELIGTPLPGWKLSAGYAIGKTEITEDSDPANVGARLFGAPEHQFTFWNTYEFQHGALKGLSVGYGLFTADDRAANEPASVYLPGYERHDAMISYKRNKVLTQLNVDNFTDEKVYDTHGNFIYPQAPLTVRGSVSIEF